MLHHERGNAVERPKIGSKFDFRSQDSIATIGGVVFYQAKGNQGKRLYLFIVSGKGKYFSRETNKSENLSYTVRSVRMPVINNNSSLHTEVDIFEEWGSSALTVRLTVNQMNRTVFVVYIVLAGNDGM
jgi:hypothetical protein